MSHRYRLEIAKFQCDYRFNGLRTGKSICLNSLRLFIFLVKCLQSLLAFLKFLGKYLQRNPFDRKVFKRQATKNPIRLLMIVSLTNMTAHSHFI